MRCPRCQISDVSIFHAEKLFPHTKEPVQNAIWPHRSEERSNEPILASFIASSFEILLGVRSACRHEPSAPRAACAQARAATANLELTATIQFPQIKANLYTHIVRYPILYLLQLLTILNTQSPKSSQQHNYFTHTHLTDQSSLLTQITPAAVLIHEHDGRHQQHFSSTPSKDSDVDGCC